MNLNEILENVKNSNFETIGEINDIEISNQDEFKTRQVLDLSIEIILQFLPEYI